MMSASDATPRGMAMPRRVTTRRERDTRVIRYGDAYDGHAAAMPLMPVATITRNISLP